MGQSTWGRAGAGPVATPAITVEDIYNPPPTPTQQPRPTLLRFVRRTDSDDRHGDLLDIIDLPATTRVFQSRRRHGDLLDIIDSESPSGLSSTNSVQKESNDNGETFFGTLLQCGGRAKQWVHGPPKVGMHCGGR